MYHTSAWGGTGMAPQLTVRSISPSFIQLRTWLPSKQGRDFWLQVELPRAILDDIPQGF